MQSESRDLLLIGDEIQQNEGFKNVSLGSVLSAALQDKKVSFLAQQDQVKTVLLLLVVVLLVHCAHSSLVCQAFSHYESSTKQLYMCMCVSREEYVVIFV